MEQTKETKPEVNEDEGRELSSANSGLLWAIAIMVGGVVMLLDQMDIVSADSVESYWPLALGGLGVALIALRGQLLQKVTGVLMILGASIYMLKHLGLLRISGDPFWPLVIISAGVLMLVKALDANSGNVGEPTMSTGFQREVCILSGCQRVNESSAFRGADLFALFGGIDIDLSNTKMAGERAEIGATSILGGIQLRIPQDWSVVSQATCIMGGIQDKTRMRAPGEANSGKTVYITGLVLLGGVEIKN